MQNELKLDIRQSANVKIGLGNVIEYANDYILSLLEYKLTDFVTQKPKIICHPEMPDIIHDTIGGFIMNYEEGIAILKHITNTGNYFWAFTHFKPVYKPDGSFEAFLTRRKPIPSKKITGEIEHLKNEIDKLYSIIKEIENHTGEKYAKLYLEGFLEYKGYQTLKDYYMSFFNFKTNELEEYFSINEKTSDKVIRKYQNIITVF